MEHDLTQAVLRGATINDARKEFTVDRSKFLNASEAMSCVRRVWFSKQPEGEFQKGEESWGFARRGTHVEEYVLSRLKDANVPLMFGPGSPPQSYFSEKLRLSATPDDVIANDDGTLTCVEIKSIDPRTNRSKLPKDQHVAQLKIAMAMTEETLNKRVAGGLILYINASDYDDLTQFDVAPDPAFVAEMAKRSAKIFRTQKPDILDREGKRTDECKYCPFREACGVVLDAPEAGTAKSRRGSVLGDAVELLGQLKAQEALKKDATETIKAELRKRNVNEISVAGYTVTLTPVKGRLSLDKKAVKAAGIDLSPYESEGAPSERLDVKPAA
jgi:CRISPR/Cas system-associated exonuclease Cas4 (RecB family)